MTNNGDWAEEAVKTISAGVVPTEGVLEKDMGGSGGGVNAPGPYHFVVTGCSEKRDEGKTPHILLQCSVLDADYKSPEQKAQIDKVLYHRVFFAKKEKDANGQPTGRIIPLEVGDIQIRLLLRFAFGLGLISADELNGKPSNINWEASVGRQFCAKVTAKVETWEDKQRTRHEIPFSEIYSVTDPFVESWPKNPEYLQIALDESGLNEEVAAMASGSSDDGLGDLADL